MKKSVMLDLFLTVCVFLGLALAARAQTIQKNDRFWDGETLWEVDAIFDDKTVFMTGTGEIYLSLEIVKDKVGEYKIVRSGDESAPFIPGVKFGWRVQHIRQDDMNFLAIRKPNGDIMWSMVLTPDGLADCLAQEERLEGELPGDILTNTLLNRHYLSKIPNKKELRLMRNEILARHGYRFSSPDLKEWFEGMPWYTPCEDNNAIKLNIIEEANVQLIKSEEADRQPVKAESLVGEWCWVGKDVPELILDLGSGNKAPRSNGLAVKSLYRYRIENYKDPELEFDGEIIFIRKEVGENAYLELNLKPVGDELTGRCVMIGILEKDFDGEITLRRDYFEY